MMVSQEEGVGFLSRRMQMKQSIFKCLECEKQAKTGIAVPYLFHQTKRGNKCPVCGSSQIQKISISAVIGLRWNKEVKKRLKKLRG